MKKHKIPSIHVSEALFEAVLGAARERGLSINELVRTILRESLKVEEKSRNYLEDFDGAWKTLLDGVSGEQWIPLRDFYRLTHAERARVQFSEWLEQKMKAGEMEQTKLPHNRVLIRPVFNKPR